MHDSARWKATTKARRTFPYPAEKEWSGFRIVRAGSPASRRRSEEAVHLMVVGLLTIAFSSGCVTWMPGTAELPHPVTHLLPDAASIDSAHRFAAQVREQAAAPGRADGADAVLLRPIDAVRLDIRAAEGRLPVDRAVEMTGARDAVYFTSAADPAEFEYPMFIVPPDYCHRPLYFEEFALERYGESHGVLQPAVSAGRFFGNFPMLPYRLIAEPACGCVCTVGPYVPGACGPYKTYLPPLSGSAALAEAGLIAGLVLLIP